MVPCNCKQSKKVYNSVVITSITLCILWHVHAYSWVLIFWCWCIFRWCKFAKKAMTLRRNEHPQQQPHLASFSSGSASAFNSPLPSHNGFSTRTRLRPGGPLNNHYQQDNPQFHRIKNGSLPSFEDIGKLLKCPSTPFLSLYPESNFFSSFQVWKHWVILLHPTCLKRMVNSYWTEDLTLVPSNPTRVLLPLWSSRKQQVVPVPECKCTERVWYIPMPGMPSKPKKLLYNGKTNLYLTLRPKSLYQYTFWKCLVKKAQIVFLSKEPPLRRNLSL